MSNKQFVIVDHTQTDDMTAEPLFWSNEDGWVCLFTPSVLVVNEGERATLWLPIGGDVKWVSMDDARNMVASARHTGKHTVR